ncbi:hypothetical protein [Aquimarina brevivitae]|uniref:Uncharacterized protein n=1 Tax=Aquimarina brevivitae TaxID=323412 RepID=A0A4Q7NZ79_9FLAO|nr:hypothetical protein [Aquimarina brevivitae]RZS92308.1 hypothetical protein EV197_2946 [Aquimarina brevivitae]
MKLSISLQIALLVFLFPVLIFSQSEMATNDLKWMKNWTNFDPSETYYPEADKKLPNVIDKDTYLNNSSVYLLSGNTYVTNNAKLTIEEGTIIRCDRDNPSSLIVTKGATLIARGSYTKPIVFTSNQTEKSRKPGDWGGISIAGGGSTNTLSGMGRIEGDFNPILSGYGGNTADEITTILSYIRIEYAGKKINRSKELNGLSLYALGKNSIISNIMVSYSADDSYEFFGGNAELSNLISFKAKDDDFDFTEGFQGNLTNIVAIRHPYISDTSGSYAIEIDGYTEGKGVRSISSLSKVSIDGGYLISLSEQDNYQYTVAAISAKYRGQLTLTNSRISGFANIVAFDASYSNATEIKNAFTLENSVFNVHGEAIQTALGNNATLQNLVKYNMYTNHFKEVTDFFSDPMNKHLPDFSLKDNLGNYTVMH